ncbi:MAG: LamG domain-containing protein [Thiotrichaceae bacterium]|nr:LamG domain-containing protein [Thiotrichaceae bacterium]
MCFVFDYPYFTTSSSKGDIPMKRWDFNTSQVEQPDKLQWHRSVLNWKKKLFFLGTTVSLMIPSMGLQAATANIFNEQALYISCNGEIKDNSQAENIVENSGVTLKSDRMQNNNQSCYFDGQSYLKVNKGFMDSSDFTLSAWVFLESYDPQASRAIISNYAGSANGLQHYGVRLTTKGKAGVFYDDGTTFDGVASSSQITDGNWHHIAAVFSGGNSSAIYVDGVLQRNDSSVPVKISPNQDLYIGRGGLSEGAAKRFSGIIDEIRIYSKALSSFEVDTVAAIMNLPTGETFIPLGNQEKDQFIAINTQNSDAPDLLVTPNTDGSMSMKMLPNSQRITRSDEEDFSSTTFTLMPNGQYDVTDDEFPSMAASFDASGNFKVEDKDFPGMQALVTPDGDGYVVKDDAFPNVTTWINPDSTLSIIDAEEPGLSVKFNKDGTYTAIDAETGFVTSIDKKGNAILTDPTEPGVAVTFNIDDAENTMMLVNTTDGTCTPLAYDSREVRGWLSRAWKKVKRVVKKVVRVVKKVVNVVKKVVSFVKKAIPFVKKVISAWKKFSGWISCIWKCLPLIGKVALIATGVGIVAAGAIILAKKVKSYLDARKTRSETVVVEEVIVEQVENANEPVDQIPDPDDDNTRSRKTRSALQCNEIQASVAEMLSSLAVGNPDNQTIVLSWHTDTEINITGFNIWRTTQKDADNQLINPVKLNEELIGSKVTEEVGDAQYNYVDSSAHTGTTYYYVIESVDTEGSKVQHSSYIVEGLIKKEPSTLVHSSSFSVSFLKGQTQFAWSTLSEQTTAAFNIWRATPKNADCNQYADYSDINRLNNTAIPATGFVSGHSYLYQTIETAKSYCYGLEEKLLNGTSVFYISGPSIDGVATVTP